MSSSRSGVSSTPCRVKGDITWAHVSESIDDNGRKMLKCLYCGKTTRGGGIYRMKQHLAGKKGDVGPCTKVPHDVRFQMANALEEIVAKNKEKQEFRRHATPFGATIPPFEGDIAVEEFEGLSHPMNMTEGNTGIGSSKKQIRLTNDSKRKRPIGVGDFFAPRTTSGAQPSIKSVLAGKEAKWRADMAVVRFLYDACIPLNALNSIYFQPMLDAITAIGPGYKQPTYYEARVNLLNDSKKEVQLLIDSYRKNWEEVGCTLMADGWTDISSRSLINFLVYCPKGICFIKSVDASGVVKGANTLFGLFEDIVLWVGPKSIVHFVTDNGANYKAAGGLLSEKYKNITWSPCAAHSINLILKDIGEMDHIIRISKCASLVTKFIYNHTLLIAWLRKREGWREIIRPGVTRFATTFIALQSLFEHKHDLQAMVTDRFFIDSRYAKSNQGKEVVIIILNNAFWNEIGIIVKVVGPLMRLLRIVDSDERPSLGYVYDGIYRARLGIKKLFKNKKKFYKPYTQIIKLRWDRTLRRGIHAAAYYLNPAFQYDRESFCTKPEVLQGFLDVVESKTCMFNVSKAKLVEESRMFRDCEGSFSRQLAIETCKTTRPDEWWRTYGYSTPNLQKFAIKILSQTSTSSGCERNWSVFERIHTKKRNRLEHQRVNDLVFIHYNLRLQNRLCYKKSNFDPIDYESIDKTDFWIVDEEEEFGELNADELDQMLYGEGSIPINNDSTNYDLSHNFLDNTIEEDGVEDEQLIEDATEAMTGSFIISDNEE